MKHLTTIVALAAACLVTTPTFAQSDASCSEKLERADKLTASMMTRIDDLRTALNSCEGDHAKCLTQRDTCAGKRDELAVLTNALRAENADLRTTIGQMQRPERIVPMWLHVTTVVAATGLGGAAGFCAGAGCSGEVTVGLGVGAVAGLAASVVLLLL